MRVGNMPKIKIFKIDEKIESDDCYSTRYIGAGLSNWETVTKEELDLIKTHQWVIEKELGLCVIVEECDKKIIDFIPSIKKFVKKKVEEEKAEINKREEENKERKKKLAEAKKARELKRLQELKAKYG